MEEIWKDIKGYEGLYQVSNLGRIKSLSRECKHSLGGNRKVTERIIKLTKDKDGYYKVMLHKNTENKTFRVHRLVAQAFINNPTNAEIVNHKDENPSNNRVDNLEWCNKKYNNTYGTKIKRQSKKIKREVYQYDLQGNFINKYNSVKEAGTSLGVNRANIANCCRGLTKTAYGFIWRYTKESG